MFLTASKSFFGFYGRERKEFFFAAFFHIALAAEMVYGFCAGFVFIFSLVCDDRV